MGSAISNLLWFLIGDLAHLACRQSTSCGFSEISASKETGECQVAQVAAWWCVGGWFGGGGKGGSVRAGGVGSLLITEGEGVSEKEGGGAGCPKDVFKAFHHNWHISHYLIGIW